MWCIKGKDTPQLQHKLPPSKSMGSWWWWWWWINMITSRCIDAVCVCKQFDFIVKTVRVHHKVNIMLLRRIHSMEFTVPVYHICCLHTANINIACFTLQAYCMLHTCCKYVASMLQTYYKHIASTLWAYCKHIASILWQIANILQACFKNIASILQHVAKIW